jgi:large conductance mechanosensitive channel protein
MKELQNFKEFVAKQGVVGFAVGLVLGSAVADFVNVFIASMVTPLVNKIFSWLGVSDGLANANIGIFGVGVALLALINFLIICFVVYMLVHKLKLDRLDKK